MSSDSVELTCRQCGSKNRIPVERALEDLSQPRCGSCKINLLRVDGEALVGLDPDALAHPWDREALEKLQSIPYADKLISTVMGSTVDKLARFQLLAGAIQVSERQAPRLLALYLEAARRLDIDPPPLYITQSPTLNAYAMGAGEPLVAVTTGLLDTMEEREILGILGHELTHVKLGHVLYRTLAILIINGGLGLLDKFMGLGSLLVTPIKIALMRWYQYAELSADRGELIATGSLETAVRAHMLLAGGSSRFIEDLDVGAFIDQAHQAEALRDKEILVTVMEMLDSTARSHPLPAWRVHHLLDWARGEDFFKILAGDYQPSLEAPPAP
ncbi:MAG: M48 family metalloprotease [Myxococcota bacterium]|nr:M48 family metalloprotease [Myxococcota bacterium]